MNDATADVRVCVLCSISEVDHAQLHDGPDGQTTTLCERYYPGGVYTHGIVKCSRCGEDMDTQGAHVCPPRVDGEYMHDWKTRIRTGAQP